jgi:hypothetical protein
MAADDAADAAFILQQIQLIEAQIIAYRTAVTAVSTNAVQSYELDTGQTRERVTKVDLLRLNGIISSLMNERATLRALLYGGSTHVTPNY